MKAAVSRGLKDMGAGMVRSGLPQWEFSGGCLDSGHAAWLPEPGRLAGVRRRRSWQPFRRSSCQRGNPSSRNDGRLLTID